MATHTAIAATTTALIRMLSDGFPSSLGAAAIEPFDGGLATAPPRMLLWLYRFVPVAAMRNRPVGGAPRPETRPGVRPAAVAVDLHYLLWAQGLAPLQQQQALGWTLRRLSDRPILTTDKLNQGGAVFEADEDVALLVEAIAAHRTHRADAALGTVPPCVLPIHARSIHLEAVRRSSRDGCRCWRSFLNPCTHGSPCQRQPSAYAMSGMRTFEAGQHVVDVAEASCRSGTRGRVSSTRCRHGGHRLVRTHDIAQRADEHRGRQDVGAAPFDVDRIGHGADEANLGGRAHVTSRCTAHAEQRPHLDGRHRAGVETVRARCDVRARSKIRHRRRSRRDGPSRDRRRWRAWRSSAGCPVWKRLRSVASAPASDEGCADSGRAGRRARAAGRGTMGACAIASKASASRALPNSLRARYARVFRCWFRCLLAFSRSPARR